mmetsp:Transcript_82992/g.130913  ORF Transcript_82992/g.130913 Transcript_82992/m.130913 type:complete len:206 (+) Transcript_82992:1111-1728(+)
MLKGLRLPVAACNGVAGRIRSEHAVIGELFATFCGMTTIGKAFGDQSAGVPNFAHSASSIEGATSRPASCSSLRKTVRWIMSPFTTSHLWSTSPSGLGGRAKTSVAASLTLARDGEDFSAQLSDPNCGNSVASACGSEIWRNSCTFAGVGGATGNEGRAWRASSRSRRDLRLRSNASSSVRKLVDGSLPRTLSTPTEAARLLLDA